MKEQKPGDGQTKLSPYLSPIAVWALSVGSAIGWGSLVVTGSSYLLQAGPLGSVIGLLIGLAMMLPVASHYHFLANRYPGAGGLYNYVKYIFGYDRAFLAGWFMFLIYIAIFWANAPVYRYSPAIFFIICSASGSFTVSSVTRSISARRL